MTEINANTAASLIGCRVFEQFPRHWVLRFDRPDGRFLLVGPNGEAGLFDSEESAHHNRPVEVILG